MHVQKIPKNHQCKNVSKGKWQHFQLNDEPGLATEVGTKTRTSSATPRRSRNRVAQSCDMCCTFDVVCFWVSAGSHRFRFLNYCIHSDCSWFVLQDAARIEENLILFDLFDLLLTVLYSIIYCIMFMSYFDSLRVRWSSAISRDEKTDSLNSQRVDDDASEKCFFSKSIKLPTTDSS